MRRPEISVIVTVYNCEKYIGNCLQSILAQTWQNFELLVIDDVSTDCSLEICRQAAQMDSWLRLFQMPQNSGAALTRNRGMDEAQGRFITFVDGDDVVRPEYLKTLYRQAVLYKADVLSGGSEEYDLQNNGEYIKGRTVVATDDIWVLPENAEKRLEIMLANGTSVNCWGKLYSREFIEKNKLRFDEMTNFEDCLFNFLCLYFADKYVFSGAANYCYFIRHSSLSRGWEISKADKFWQSGIRIIQVSEKWMQKMALFVQKPALKMQVKAYFMGIFLHWYMLKLGTMYSQEAINKEIQESCKAYFNEQSDFVMLLLDYCIMQQRQVNKVNEIK